MVRIKWPNLKIKSNFASVNLLKPTGHFTGDLQDKIQKLDKKSDEGAGGSSLNDSSVQPSEHLVQQVSRVTDHSLFEKCPKFQPIRRQKALFSSLWLIRTLPRKQKYPSLLQLQINFNNSSTFWIMTVNPNL